MSGSAPAFGRLGYGSAAYRDPRFLGIDIDKDRLGIHVLPAAEAFTSSTRPDGLPALARRLSGLRPALIVMEATGGYESLPGAVLAEAGLPIAIGNPMQIRAFARTFLTALPEVEMVDRHQIASLAGLAPLNRDSCAYRLAQGLAQA